MNFIEGGILNNTGNTNGLSSFTGGNGSIVLNICAVDMTTNYTANAGIPLLVSNLNTLLVAGQLSTAAQSKHLPVTLPAPTSPTVHRPPRRRCATASAPLSISWSIRRIISFKNDLPMKDKNISLITRRDFIRRAACAAVGTAAMTSAIRDLRLMNAAVAQTGITDYKALVCIFLQGGNDSNNLIIPSAGSAYNNYAAIRTPVLAIPQSAVLGVTSLNPDGNTYGLHPSCPELHALFGEGKLAFLFNTGTLVYPITRNQYLNGSISKPPQLFSHADQQTQWQTSVPDQPPVTGWGGRCADILSSVQPNAPISLMVTLAGSNTFEVGNIVAQYSVSTSGAVSLTLPGTPGGGASANRLTTLTNILGLPLSNLQAQAYAGVAEHAINSSATLNNAITNTAAVSYWTTPFPTKITPPEGGGAFTSSLSPQLQMVARLIAAGSTSVANGGFGMKRQIFFCQVGGYDLHTGQTNYSANTPNNVLLRRPYQSPR